MATLQITFVSESAGYDSAFGWYNSRTGEAGIIFISTNDDGPNAGISSGTTATLEVDQADIDAGYIGFFVIPNGADIYGTGEDSVLNGPLTFDTKPNGDGQILDADGKKLRGEQGEIIFTDRELNKHDTDYTSAHPGRQNPGDLGSDDADGITGTIAFEDLVRHSDRDYNDLVVDVQIVPENQPPVLEDAVFQVAENSAAGTSVGQVIATDPDAGQTLSYAIVGGNDSGAFAINSATGEITVADASKLDFEDPALSAYSLTVEVTDNGSGALSDTATVNIAIANVLETLQGHAVDGYVAGATVFADQDEDGQLDAGEASAITDASGNFALVDGSGPLVMTGGVDLATGLAFTGVLRAPEGSTVVTPLTTLVAALVEQGQSAAEASANIASALGLDDLLIGGQPVDLLNFDPIPDAAAGGVDGDAAAQVLAAGIQVRNTIVQVGALLAGAGATDAQAAVIAALADLASSGNPVDLADPAQVQALIDAAAETADGISPADIAAVVADAAQVLAATNAEVNDAAAGGSGVGVLESLAQVAAVAQGTSLLQALAQAGDTNDPGTLASDFTGANLEAKIDNAPVGDVDGGTTGTPGDDVLSGGPGNDVIDGLGGNDQLYGLAGNDQLNGGDGNDVLVGDIGNDTLRGGAGNDVLNGGEVADLQSDTGFRDTDRADYSTAASGVTLNLAAGVAQDGDGGTDTLIGVEAVTGSAYDDALTGGSNAFVEFFRGGPGNDTIDGGNWNDRAEYMNATGGIAVNLAALAPNMGTVTGDASVGSDTLINVEMVYGSDFADSYIATGFLSASQPGGVLSNFNAFEGRAGNDTIVGNGGTRIEFTAATAGVVVNLAAGIATGNDSVGTDNFSGVISARGSSYADTLLGGSASGTEIFEGRGGDDFVDGGLGFDLAVYAFDGPVSTGITVNLAAGTVTGDPLLTGTDTLRGIEGVRGSHLNDWYDATGYSSSSLNAGSLGPSGTYNEFEGMAGNDTITGNGNTRIIYTAAREGVSVDLAAGTAVGGASVGTDTILGGVWAARGSNFTDSLSGSDSLAAEYFEGRAGDDFIDGKDGFDVAAFDVGASGGGTFIATGPSSFTATAPGLGTDLLFNIEQITGTGFGDLFDGSASLLNHTFLGLGGNDTLIGSQGSDFLSGGDGNDVLAGGAGNDFMDGGFGIDRADYSAAFGPVNTDLMAMTASDGMGGTDTFNGIEDVTGSAFDDALFGDAANNALFGGMGNDVLRGREGADYIDGGLGVDRIEFFNPWDGMDTISGFEAVPGGDVIDIENLLLNWTGYAGGAGGPLSNFVRLETVGPDAQLQIDVDGLGPMFWQPLATLLGGGGLSLNTLVANGNLDTGVVSGVTLLGTPGNDFLDGTPGNDTILADLGNDFLRGRGGNDLLNGGVVADLQSDVGWRDSDRIDYSSAFTGVNVNLGTGIAQDGEGGTDTLIGIESVTGSFYNDLLTGSGAFFESFLGNAGDDMINGAGGLDSADYSTASSGVSISLGGFGGFSTSTGSVSGDASVGFDTLLDVEQFIGSNSADTLTVGLFLSASSPGGVLSSFNALQGRGGNDAIFGNGNTRIEYSGATSAVNVNLVTGKATGDASVGTDSFSGVNQIRGSSFADTLVGGNPLFDGFESFDGRGGNDFIDGGQGWDRADYGFNGPVTTGITVNLAAGTVTGDPVLTGSDTLLSIEAVRGSHLADSYDATGFSEFSANAGSSGTLNEFEGGAGNDTILGNGNTRVSYSFAREAVSVNLQAGAAVGGASVGTDAILGGVNAARGSNFDDVLVGSASNDVLEGLSGNDLLRGGQGADFINGGLGSDRIDFDSLLDAWDTISGFEAVPGGDVIDIADLLSSSTSYAGGAGGPLANFVRVETFGPDAQLEIDPDGVAGPASWQPLATLLGRAGLTLDTLVANGNLDTGAVSGVTLIGTTGNDTLIGGPGNDTLIADLGNDFLQGRGGNDLLNGGVIADLQSDVGWRDTDRADYSSAFTGVIVDLGSGIAQDGEGGTDTLFGIESVNGSMFSDVFTGSSAFQENFRGGAGNDFINGGGGFDRAEYFDAMTGVTINVGGLGDAGASVSGDPAVGFDSLTNVEQFTGSNWDDTYTAGWFLSDSLPGGFLSSFNAFEGRGGNDFITGNGNTRVEYANATGPVTVNLATGAAGDASVGNDSFNGGINAVRGSSFADTLIGTASFSDESFDGRGGNDTINGGGGFDRGDYGFNGRATIGINVNLAAGTVSGDPVLTGTDTLIGIEAIRGTHLDDVYNATGFSGSGPNPGSLGTLNEFEGMAGNDMVTGNGNTRLTFASAREGVTVDLQAGTAIGGASVGHDTIVAGVNAMRGSNFDDVLMGTNHGITSAQIYEGRAGNDTFSGRGGFDQAVYVSEGAQTGITVDMDAINAFTGSVVGDAAIGTDTLVDIVSVVGTLFNDFYDATGYNSAISTLGTFNEFEGSFGDDTIIGNGNTRASYIGAGAPVTVNLGAAGSASGASTGADTLINVFSVRGSNFDDTLLGSSANDTFEGRGGFDTISGGDGFDLVRYDNGSNGSGSFISTGSGSFTASAGGHATDTLTSIESIRGTNFGDLFDGTGSVQGYTFDGRGGNDTLIGSNVSDTLLGGDGNDLLRGGQGADTIDSGLGSDRIDFDSLLDASDTIANFDAVAGGDVLDIADLLAFSTSYAGGLGGPLSDFVQLQTAGSDAQLQIDASGSAGGANWETLATLLGDAGLSLDNLLTNGNLDTVI